ncbi:hypothetical protein DFH06DRAFT_106224 [Mycena polygramma]|nr:hypothetical protein DFH06DRAFT_106224 [Mycena polygramma]
MELMGDVCITTPLPVPILYAVCVDLKYNSFNHPTSARTHIVVPSTVIDPSNSQYSGDRKHSGPVLAPELILAFVTVICSQLIFWRAGAAGCSWSAWRQASQLKNILLMQLQRAPRDWRDNHQGHTTLASGQSVGRYGRARNRYPRRGVFLSQGLHRDKS